MTLTAAQKQKRYREKMRAENPEKYEIVKKKNAERNKQRKKIADYSEEEKEKERKIWRDKKKKQTAKKCDGNEANILNEGNENSNENVTIAQKARLADRRKNQRHWAFARKEFDDRIKQLLKTNNTLRKKLNRSTSNVNFTMDKGPSVRSADINSAMKKNSLGECRACLQKIDKHTAYNLFEAWFTPWAVRGAIIADDLSKFADVEISELDKYSKIMCQKCYHRLSDACTFMITVQTSDRVLRQRVDENKVISTTSVVGASWPQPILLNKSGNGDIEVEIKQEVLSEDEDGVNADRDWEPTMDIKIEPEEISAPVQCNTQVNGILSRNESVELNGSSSNFEQKEYLDDTIKQEPVSGDELMETVLDLPLDCMLCFKVFNSVSGLKAHVISQHSYGAVKRKAESILSAVQKKNPAKKYDCNSCNQSFATSTDLMVHRVSHSEHVCYVCDRRFSSFQHLTRHGPRCQKTRRDYSRPVPKPKQLSQPVKNTTNAQNQEAKTDEREIKPKSPPIEDVVAENVKELVAAWPCTDEVENESSLENEVTSKAQVELVDKKQNLEALNQEPMIIDMESLIDKIHESIDDSKCLPLKVEIEESIKKQSDNGLLEPENRLPQPETEEKEAEEIQEDSQNKHLNHKIEPKEEALEYSQNKPLSDEIEVEPMEEVQEETQESQLGPLRKDSSETPDSSSEIVPSNPTPESTSDSLQNINCDKLLFSKNLETVDKNSLHESVSSSPNQDDPKDLLTNLSSCEFEEPRIETQKLTEEVETNIEQMTGLRKASITEENLPEEKNTTIDELSEMKVHLEINPLDKNIVLFETEMEDIECRNSDSCEPKLVSAISDQSDSQHS